MKKKYIIGMGLALCLVGAACGKKQENDVTPTTVVTATPTPETEQGSGITNFPLPSQEPTRAPEPTPTLRCETKAESDQMKDGDTVIFQWSVSYPQFAGIGAEALNQKVDALVAEFKKSAAEYQKSAESDYKSIQKTGGDYELREENLLLNVAGLSEDMISLIAVRVSMEGGPHPNFAQLGYVYRISDGSEVTLADYLKGKKLTAEQIAERACEDFGIHVNNNEAAFILKEGKTLQETVLALLMENRWYFTEGGIQIFLNPYDIADFAFGAFTSEIPAGEL